MGWALTVTLVPATDNTRTVSDRRGPCQTVPMRALLLCLLLVTPSHADTPLTAEAFDALTLGRSLSYSADGAVYGSEDYLRNRRVRWAFLDGECMEGRWYPEGDRICFVYDEIFQPQCWWFYEDAGRITGIFDGEDPLTLVEIGERDAPLACPGPMIGV